MKTVFLGGSRRIARLNDSIRAQLDDLIRRELRILIGDANGADRAMQEHLRGRNYGQVLVYAMNGKARNNLHGWEARAVEAPKGARGFDLYSVKDRKMAEDADCGLMLWDGESRGTLENIRTLLAQGKPVALYLARDRRFIGLRTPEDLKLLGVEPTSRDCALQSQQTELPFATELSFRRQLRPARS